MNQDNKEFELSGTLGNLSDAALNNLANQNPNETELKEPQINMSESTEIEMLDFETPTTVVPESNTFETNEKTVSQSEEPIFNLNSNDAFNLNNNTGIQTELNPIPTNFNIGDIGSVPPIDPTGKGEKKKNHVLFIIIVIILIFAVGALVYYYLRVSRGTVSNAVITKNITLNLGDELPTDINEYAEFKTISSSNCVLNTQSVDIAKPGNYEYKITCGSNEYKGNITLNDTNAPAVKTKAIVKKVEETVTAEEFIAECDEPSGCTYAFENEENVTNNLKQAGTYDINVLVKDASNNSVTVPVKLIVIDTDIKVYLNCSSPTQTIDGFNGTVINAEKIGISTESLYNGVYFKINIYTAADADVYNQIKNNYQQNNILDINGGLGIPVFDDKALTITFEELLGGEAEFGNDYSSIRKYYETTKSYQCKIEPAN